jgi:hypothetical protein
MPSSEDFRAKAQECLKTAAEATDPLALRTCSRFPTDFFREPTPGQPLGTCQYMNLTSLFDLKFLEVLRQNV